MKQLGVERITLATWSRTSDKEHLQITEATQLQPASAQTCMPHAPSESPENLPFVLIDQAEVFNFDHFPQRQESACIGQDLRQQGETPNRVVRPCLNAEYILCLPPIGRDWSRCCTGEVKCSISGNFRANFMRAMGPNPKEARMGNGNLPTMIWPDR